MKFAWRVSTVITTRLAASGLILFGCGVSADGVGAPERVETQASALAADQANLVGSFSTLTATGPDVKFEILPCGPGAPPSPLDGAAVDCSPANTTGTVAHVLVSDAALAQLGFAGVTAPLLRSGDTSLLTSVWLKSNAGAAAVGTSSSASSSALVPETLGDQSAAWRRVYSTNDAATDDAKMFVGASKGPYTGRTRKGFTYQGYTDFYFDAPSVTDALPALAPPALNPGVAAGTPSQCATTGAGFSAPTNLAGLSCFSGAMAGFPPAMTAPGTISVELAPDSAIPLPGGPAGDPLNPSAVHVKAPDFSGVSFALPAPTASRAVLHARVLVKSGIAVFSATAAPGEITGDDLEPAWDPSLGGPRWVDVTIPSMNAGPQFLTIAALGYANGRFTGKGGEFYLEYPQVLDANHGCACAGGTDEHGQPVEVSATFCGFQTCGADAQVRTCGASGFVVTGSCTPPPPPVPTCAAGQTYCGSSAGCIDPLTDDGNCGACGNACVTGCGKNGASPGYCVTPLATNLDPPAAMVVRGTTAYWVNTGKPGAANGTLQSAPVAALPNLVNGVATPATPATLASGLDYPDSIAIDGNNIYWIEQGATITATTSEYTTLPERTITDFVFDSSARTFGTFTVTFPEYQDLNWITSIVQAPTSRLAQMPLSGGPITYLALAGGTPIFGHPNGTLTNRTVTGMVTVAAPGASVGDAVEEAVSVHDNSVGANPLYGDFVDNNIVETSVVGLPDDSHGNPRVQYNGYLLEQTGERVGIQSLAVDGQFVYFTAYDPSFPEQGTVNRVPIGGGPVTVLASNQVRPVDISVDANNVYWATRGNCSGITAAMSDPSVPTGNACGAVMSLPRAGGSASVLTPAAYAIDGQAQTPDETALYSLARPGLAVDSSNVYYTFLKQFPFSTPLSGSGATQLAPSSLTTVPSVGQGVLSVESLAVDDSFVYVALWSGPFTQRAFGEVPLLSPDQSEEQLAPDTIGSVVKIPKDGGAPITLATHQSPVSITVDANSVYWTNFGGSVVRLSPKTAIAGSSPTPDFGVSANPITVSVSTGDGTIGGGNAGSTSVAIAPTGGFNAPVTVDPTPVLGTVPTGVTVSFNGAWDPNRPGPIPVTIVASYDAVVGAADLTYTASGGGVSHRFTIHLKVNQGPDFSLAVSPTSATDPNTPLVLVRGASPVPVSLSSVPIAGGFPQITESLTAGTSLPPGVSIGSFSAGVLLPATSNFSASAAAVPTTTPIPVTLQGLRGLGVGPVRTVTIYITVQ